MLSQGCLPNARAAVDRQQDWTTRSRVGGPAVPALIVTVQQFGEFPAPAMEEGELYQLGKLHRHVLSAAQQQTMDDRKPYTRGEGGGQMQSVGRRQANVRHNAGRRHEDERHGREYTQVRRLNPSRVDSKIGSDSGEDRFYQYARSPPPRGSSLLAA
jgi:hypothetical protein